MSMKMKPRRGELDEMLNGGGGPVVLNRFHVGQKGRIYSLSFIISQKVIADAERETPTVV